MSVIVRNVEPRDVPDIRGMIVELARYEEAEDEAIVTEDQLHHAFFRQGATAHALVAEVDGQIMGMAVWFFTFSTWQGRDGLYLEDLFVRPAARGKKAGLALMKALANIAIEHDCGRFEWSVLDWNSPAIAFYERISATPQPGWTRYRLDGDTLNAAANITL